MIRINRQFLLLLMVCLVIFPACGTGKRRTHIDVSEVSLQDVKIHRYDLDLFRVRTGMLQQDLEVLRPAYRFFLDADLSDTARLNNMKAYLENPRNVDFQGEAARQYRDVSGLEKGLTEAYRHLKYYYPGVKVPRVYSYISGGDYDNPVRFADTVLLIGIDNYLGKDFKPYMSDGVPLYRILRMNRDFILPDCMRVLADNMHPQELPGNNLLGQMVEAGKQLYFIDAMIPSAEDCFKIGYSREQYDWIMKNESHVWAAIIENRMLYTTDARLLRTFMADGPFTAEFSKEAPPRLGEWLGWQIVRNYMEKQSSVTLPELMNEKDPQKILSLSGYKPKK